MPCPVQGVRPARACAALRAARRDCLRAAEGVERHAIVANVDTAFLVGGLELDVNLRRLERYLAFVRLAGVQAVVVLTQADLVPDAPARAAEVRARLWPGEDAVVVNALDPLAAVALEPWLAAGRTVVLLGSSGVGKSTLTNTLTALAGSAAAQATGPVRRGDGRGRHTATARTWRPRGALEVYSSNRYTQDRFHKVFSALPPRGLGPEGWPGSTFPVDDS